ncbi:hypothetical protein V6N13_149311 [Hibiscus sabdariffa]
MDAATGHQGERPPDPVVVIEMSHIEDRPSLHVSPESQPTQKRGHAMEVPLHEADDMDVVIMDDGVGGGASPSTMLTCSEGLAPVMSSFKEKLMGPTRVMRDMQYISELDVEVPEEDVRVGGDSTLPAIQFSDRVHDAIDAKLASYVII